jgi:pimeloyl-ACP methyl ester carboxylesterase
MPTTKANGIELYYEVHGEGPPLLLIMGLGANATAWYRQIPVLSERYRVIAFDNRGAGRSEKPLEPYSIPQMADDAAALMDTLGISTSHVFGMSLGGMIAQEYALRHPERVQALVLGGTTPAAPRQCGPARRLSPSSPPSAR